MHSVGKGVKSELVFPIKVKNLLFPVRVKRVLLALVELKEHKDPAERPAHQDHLDQLGRGLVCQDYIMSWFFLSTSHQ